MMKVEPTTLEGAMLITPRRFEDPRGYFCELWSRRGFARKGLPEHEFVQDNYSFSRASVVRGLHYQLGAGQGKLVCVVSGRVLDVGLDLRPGSSTFGEHVMVELSAKNQQMLLLPAGFAHGFVALEASHLFYKCTDVYRPELERGVRWDDPQLEIPWPVRRPLISERDAALPLLGELTSGDLPGGGDVP